MLSMLYEIHFWTTHDNVYLSNNDFSSFKYYEKKDVNGPSSFEKKKAYALARHYTWTLSNKKTPKLKHLVKDLEENLRCHRIVRIKWLKEDTVLLFLNSGLIIYILINLLSGDIINIGFDKYLKDKLLTPHVSDVLLTNIFSVCCYNDPQLTLIHYSKPAYKKIYKKLSDLEPKFSSVNLPCPNGRRVPRNLCVNKTGDVIAIWWKYCENDVFPWSPLVKDVDRSNVHVYSVAGSKLDLLCYYRTEYDLLCMAFSSAESNILYAVEQKVSREGDISIESSTFEIVKCSRLQKSNVVCIPLRSGVCSVEFSPDRRNLLLGCVDGTLVLYNQTRALTHVVQTVFVPSLVRWHADGFVVAVASDRGEIQCFDFALSCIKMQGTSEDITPSNITDLSVYFAQRSQSEPPVLEEMQWNVTNSKNETSDSPADDGFLLLTFNAGPLVIIRFFGAAVLTPEILVSRYLREDHVDKAINILLAVDWDTDSVTCSTLLNMIANHIFISSSSPTEKYSQIQTAVGSFYVPVRPLCQSVEAEFYKLVRNISRRLFHYVLRLNLTDYALTIAKHLNEHDLFMDLYYYAKSVNNATLAIAAEEKAQQIIAQESVPNPSSDSEDCDCSCSECSSENSDLENAKRSVSIIQQLPTPPINYSSPTTHMSYASVTRVNPSHQRTTIEQRRENIKDLPQSSRTSCELETSKNHQLHANHHKKATAKVEQSVSISSKDAAPTLIKTLSPITNSNLCRNIPSDIAQGLLQQAGLSENKMMESKSIKVVHFGVV